MMLIKHLHPAALKGLGKPFDAALKKNMPHPSPIPLFKLPGLFKLPAPLTILAGERCSLLRPNLGYFCPQPLVLRLQEIFMTPFLYEEKRSRQRWGSVAVKKLVASLEPFKGLFQSLPFCGRVEML